MGRFPKFFFSQSLTALPPAILGILYFYFLPPVPFFLAGSLLAVWPFGFLLDAKSTIKRSWLISKHEVNAIFPALCSKFGPRFGCVVQFLLESLIVCILPVLFIHRLDVVASSVVSSMFMASHVFAFFSNKRIVC